jgi:hypothetical protein
MPATPIFALPYPNATDTADVPRDIQALAVKLDALALVPALVSSLPGSPADGQEVYYLANAANGVVWHLRYRAAASGSYKWEFIGGGLMAATVDTAEAKAVAAFSDLATPGPTVTVPLAGNYEVEGEAQFYTAVAAATTGSIGISIGGAVPTTGDQSGATSPSTNQPEVIVFSRGLTIAAPNTALKIQYSITAAVNCTWGRRRIRARPIRVG